MNDKNALLCPFCTKIIEENCPSKESRRLSFRASCPHCHRDLHACLACQYYCPGKPNSCLIPGTEPISDRSKNNFCDEYLLTEKGSFQESSDEKRLEEIRKQLFGE